MCGRVKKPGIRTKVNPKTILHMKKENRQKRSVFAGFVAGAEGLDLGCRLGCCSPVGSAQHRPRREPRPARQSATGARSPLDTLRVPRLDPSRYEKRETSRRLSLFFGRGRRTWSPLRSGRLVACVPLARTRPPARGFGVDGGESSRERGSPSVTRFLPQVRKGAVLVWCCERNLGGKIVLNGFF